MRCRVISAVCKYQPHCCAEERNHCDDHAHTRPVLKHKRHIELEERLSPVWSFGPLYFERQLLLMRRPFVVLSSLVGTPSFVKVHFLRVDTAQDGIVGAMPYTEALVAVP